MNCRCARFTAAGLVLAPSLPVAMSATSPATTVRADREVPRERRAAGSIPPRRPPVRREALEGKEYAIRLHNPYPVRVAVALSVDGLNTIDARETTAIGARKWVLGAYQTATISGWQTSQTEARRFEFTTEAGSYGQAIGKTANLGVISAVFFKERVPAPPRDTNEYAAAGPGTRRAGRSGRRRRGPSSRRRAVWNEYAATGMGRRTDHAVTRVWLDLEETPAQTVNIRYEFRPQLVRLGILPRVQEIDPLTRREGARGFEPGFAPVPSHLR